MKTLSAVLMCAAMSLASVGASAQDAMKKDDAMMKKEMSMQDCKDHMAMAKKDGMKKDDAMMKKESMCADMMKKHDGMMKKDGMPAETMKK